MSPTKKLQTISVIASVIVLITLALSLLLQHRLQQLSLQYQTQTEQQQLKQIKLEKILVKLSANSTVYQNNEAQQRLLTIENIKQEILAFTKLTTSNIEFHSLTQAQQALSEYQTSIKLNGVESEQTNNSYGMLLNTIVELTKTVEQTNKKNNNLLFKQINDSQYFTKVFVFFCIPIVMVLVVIGLVNIAKILKNYAELSTVFKVSPDGFLVVEKSGIISKVNPTCANMFGYTEKELVGQQVETLVPANKKEQHTPLRQSFQNTMQNRNLVSPHSDVYGLKKDGSVLPLKIKLSSVRINGVYKTVAAVTDLSLFKNLETLSTTDHLTNISNRMKLDNILDSELQRYSRYKIPLSIIMCDIDHFKNINDEFGHQVGDDVLQNFTSLIKQRIRNTDFVGRWGGDEFCIICPNTNLKQAHDLAQQLRKIVENFDFAINSLVTTSLGVATCLPEDTPVSLMHRADMALYQSKQMGRNQVSLASNEDTVPNLLS